MTLSTNETPPTDPNPTATAAETLSAAELRDDRIAWLRDLYPDAFADGAIDFERLRATMAGSTATDRERYGLNWTGKRASIELLRQKSRGALVPDRDESVDFDEAPHVFIEGDNLETLKLLYRAYAGRVKLIYVDVPYNTGNDFVYRDDFTDPLDAYLQMSGQADEEGNLLVANPESSGRYHSAWLSMMYPRMYMARQLLSEDGVIFISIDDHEVANLRLVMDEVYGEENFIAQIVVQLNPRGRHLSRFVAKTHEYLLVYARNAQQQSLYAIEKDERMLREYNKTDADDRRYREIELRNRNPAFNSRTRPTLYFPIYVDPATGGVAVEQDEMHSVGVLPKNSEGGESAWTWSKQKVHEDAHLVLGRQTDGGSWRIFRKDYLIQGDGTTATTLPKALWTDPEINNDKGKEAVQELFERRTLFDFPKSPALMRKIIEMGAGTSGVVLDFFAGSCTMAQAVLEANAENDGSLRFVMVQLPEQTPDGSPAREAGYETISALGRERIRRVIAKLRGEGARADGFRSLRLTESGHRQWRGTEEQTAESLAAEMELFIDPLLPGWTVEGILYELLLAEGMSLASEVTEVDGGDNTVFRVEDKEVERVVFICLDDAIDTNLATVLQLDNRDVFICRDSALTDEAAANLALQCRLKTV